FFREGKRNLFVARAMQEQERAGHLLHDTVEPKPFELLERRRPARHAEDPLQMLRWHRERKHLAGGEFVEPLCPDGVIVPLRAPGDAAGKSRLERSGPRRVVTAQAEPHHADAVRIELVAGAEIFVGGGAVALGLRDWRPVARAAASPP